MKTFVIRCNDSVEAVVIGDEGFANAEMKRRRAADHRRDCCTFGDPCPTYARRMHWRVHEYDAVVQPCQHEFVHTGRFGESMCFKCRTVRVTTVCQL